MVVAVDPSRYTLTLSIRPQRHRTRVPHLDPTRRARHGLELHGPVANSVHGVAVGLVVAGVDEGELVLLVVGELEVGAAGFGNEHLVLDVDLPLVKKRPNKEGA